jgi:hypothetical protein
MQKRIIPIVAWGIAIFFFGLMGPVVGSSTPSDPAPQKMAPPQDTQRFNPTPPGAEAEQLREDAQQYEKVPPPQKSGAKTKYDNNRQPESDKNNP